MDTAPERGRPGALAALLCGLQAGMLGVLWMLAWLGVSALWQRLSFWTPENLMAAAFYGAGALRGGFSSRAVSGMALYLVLYSALGALFALAARERWTRTRTVLAGMLFGLGWYYLSYRLIWKGVMPLAAMLHPERATIAGHLLYGAVLGRFPEHQRPAVAASVEAAVVQVPGDGAGSESPAGIPDAGPVPEAQSDVAIGGRDTPEITSLGPVEGE
jgi:hypothetical protein